MTASGKDIPAGLTWLGTGLSYGFPNALLLFVPVAALIVFTLRRTGFGRLLYAVGDNEKATRLSGVQVPVAPVERVKAARSFA